MKVRVCFTVDVDDEFRKALRNRHGERGLATRKEVAQWYRNNASSVDDDLMYDYDRNKKRDAEEARP